MAFKRFDGFSGSAPQKKIDEGVPVCPFCGKYPHWLLELESGLFKPVVATCMCEKCGAKVKMGSKKLEFNDFVDVFDLGNVNKSNLQLSARYTMEELRAVAQEIAPESTPVAGQTATEANTPARKKSLMDEEFDGERPTLVFDGGCGDILFIFEDRLIIRHKGVANFLAMGLKGDKTIYYGDLTSVQFKKAGFTPGYIQFSLAGGREDRGGVSSATSDENSITLISDTNVEAEKTVSFINKKIREVKTAVSRPQVVSNVSSADELLKFKQLLDAGVITQEEFDAKKKQLLGL